MLGGKKKKKVRILESSPSGMSPVRPYPMLHGSIPPLRSPHGDDRFPLSSTDLEYELRIPSHLLAPIHPTSSNNGHTSSDLYSGAALLGSHDSIKLHANSTHQTPRKRSSNRMTNDGQPSDPPLSPLSDLPSTSGRLLEGVHKTGPLNSSVRIKFSYPTLTWVPAGTCMGLLCCTPLGNTLGAPPGAASKSSPWRGTGHIDLRDVVTIRLEGRAYTVFYVHRNSKKPSHWKLNSVKFKCPTAEEAREWQGALIRSLRSTALGLDRPRSLMVVINPYGGAKRADQVWSEVAEPLLRLAGVRAIVHRTERPNHARELVERMTLDQWLEIDGIVAVGGDGLFQELLNGVLSVRAQGGNRETIARRMRLGHVPAGSTDALAYSLHGTRDAMTAALHIVLGDRLPLDVLGLEAQQEDPGGSGLLRTVHTRYAVCMVSYGYFGEVMRISENLRPIGPPRYDLAGIAAFLQGKAWDLEIRARAFPLQSAGPSGSLSVPRLLHGGPSSSDFVDTPPSFSCQRGEPHSHAAAHPAARRSIDLALAKVSPAFPREHSLPPEPSSSASSVTAKPPKHSAPASPPHRVAGGGAPPSPSPAGSAIRQPLAALASPEASLHPSSYEHSHRLASSRSSSSKRHAAQPACVAGCVRCAMAKGRRVTAHFPPPSPIPSVSSAAPAVPPKPPMGPVLETLDERVSNGDAAPSAPAAVSPSQDAAATTTIEINKVGAFKALMGAIIPCRSDRSPLGLAPAAHLCDGRVSLFLVRSCSRLQYLQLLIEIASHGLTHETSAKLPFVEVLDVSDFAVRSRDPTPGVWNVDGELLQCRQLVGRVHQGLVDVFSRGVEVRDADAGAQGARLSGGAGNVNLKGRTFST